MSESGSGWVRSEGGVLVPPESGRKHVERAEFRVKVEGFKLPAALPAKVAE